MEIIKDTCYGGERALFASKNLDLENVVFLPGESALKCCSNIVAKRCEFQGKYPFWHTHGFEVENCDFTVNARAALWYSTQCIMKQCKVDAPKMFREMDGIFISETDFPNAEETLWHCSNVKIRKVKIYRADYLFMHSHDIDIEDYYQEGNYSFQYCKNVRIANADIHSKDAFWNTENVTVYDSTLTGEYLGWHSQNLTLINCKIGGTQPLCYAKGLRLVDCEFMPDADLAFEDSDLEANIVGSITSIKNPRSGKIVADKIGEIIIDENILPPASCQIVTKG